MKIVFTGGGTGGHFYPLIAVAEALRKIEKKEKLASLVMYYFSDAPYDEQELFENRITFVAIPAGKMRLYFSFKNFTDIFRAGFGVIVAIVKLFSIYPDVVFGKGGYASFPTLMAARILRIPYIIHETDSVPGRVSEKMGKHARRVGVSFAEAGQYFPSDRVAHTGQPIREGLLVVRPEGANEYLRLNPALPTILVLGGSSGAQIINEAMFSMLPSLVEKYQVIHQVGDANIQDAKEQITTVLSGNKNADRYHVYSSLDPLALSMAAGVADVIVSRGGGTIFEIASWRVPAILIPITDSHGDHQRKNAYAYARSGAGIVIEERNLGPHLLREEIDQIVDSESRIRSMKERAGVFFKPDAAEVIARELTAIALTHAS